MQIYFYKWFLLRNPDKSRRLNGVFKTCCNFLVQCKNCDRCIEDFELSSQCRHYGKRNCMRHKRDNDEILVGTTHSS